MYIQLAKDKCHEPLIYIYINRLNIVNLMYTKYRSVFVDLVLIKVILPCYPYIYMEFSGLSDAYQDRMSIIVLYGKL